MLVWMTYKGLLLFKEMFALFVWDKENFFLLQQKYVVKTHSQDEIASNFNSMFINMSPVINK